jgi:hypothetical protein
LRKTPSVAARQFIEHAGSLRRRHLLAPNRLFQNGHSSPGSNTEGLGKALGIPIVNQDPGIASLSQDDARCLPKVLVVSGASSQPKTQILNSLYLKYRLGLVKPLNDQGRAETRLV